MIRRNWVPQQVAVIGIYRKRNARYVQAIEEAARAVGWRTAWWALDAECDGLADHTVGVGSGTKIRLLNEIVERADIDQDWLVFSDDDAELTRGTIVDLVALCAYAEFDLAQPARSDDNSRFDFNVAHAITRARRFSRARSTTFVEIGPQFVVGPRWRDRIIPFPEERGMGWGLELDWHELHEEGCRLGIVDEVRVAHRGEPGGEYDFELQAHRVHGELEERGYSGWADVQRTLAVWRPWQRVPPWSSALAQGGR